MIGIAPSNRSKSFLRVVLIVVAASFVVILATTTILSQYLAGFFAQHMMMRDAVVSTELLNSLVLPENEAVFSGPKGRGSDEISETFEHFVDSVSKLPHVLRANIYSKQGQVIWSTQQSMMGRTFTENEELQSALNGVLHPEIFKVDRKKKIEHLDLPDNVTEFIEIYIPVYSEDGARIIGAVDVYKTPAGLLKTIRDVVVLSWIGAGVATLIMFLALGLLAGYSIRFIKRQERRALETERLAVVGEMASAVAHGIRNPLAAIRSCAELVSEEKIPEDSKNTVLDIIDVVDRLESWIRSFLTRTTEVSTDESGPVAVERVVEECLEAFESQIKRRSIETVLRSSENPIIPGAYVLDIQQVLNTVISNAVESMEFGGTLTLAWRSTEGARVAIEVTDTGSGLTNEVQRTLFQPLVSGKPSGLGVGLALGRRIAERIGGSLEIENGATHGVVAKLIVPVG